MLLCVSMRIFWNVTSFYCNAAIVRIFCLAGVSGKCVNEIVIGYERDYIGYCTAAMSVASAGLAGVLA